MKGGLVGAWLMSMALMASLLVVPIRSEAGTNDDESSLEDLRLELKLSRSQVYPGEDIMATVTLWVGQVSVRNVQYPVLNGRGYKLSEFASPRQKDLSREGRDYVAHEFTAILTPLKSGEIQVGPAELGSDLLVPSEGAAALFGGREPRAVKVRSSPVFLRVQPLPDAGRPAGFNGAVGRFSLTRQAAPIEIRSGDPITVTTTIRGTGNLEAFSCPSLALPGVRSYPPQARRTPQALSCEQVLVAEGPNDLSVPGADISYFDPQSGRYHKVSSAPIRIGVRDADVAQQAVSVGPVQVVQTQQGQAKDDAGRLYLTLALLAVGLMLVLAIRRVLRGRSGIKAQTVVVPALQALQASAEWLAEAKEALAANDQELFYTAVFRALQAHLGSRYGLAAGAITGEIVALNLRPRGVQDHDLAVYESLFRACDQARYAPGPHRGGSMQDIYRLLEGVMRQD